MIDYLTYIVFDDLPKEKEEKIKEWAKEQLNDDYWYFYASRLKEEYGGSFCIVTNYHYSRLRLKLYIYQLWKEYHDASNIRVEVLSDYDAEPGEVYGLAGTIEGKEFNEYFSDKTDDEWQKEIDEWHKYLDDNYNEALNKKKKASCEALKIATDLPF